MNETFWEIIDNIPLTRTSPKECMLEIGEGLSNEKDPYVKRLGQAILIWAEGF